MSEAITIQESARLVELEDVIERGLSNFIKVGEALVEIRDKRLYRVEYRTFEEYCREEWQMTQQYATQLCRSSQVAAMLESETKVSPTKEAHARPLTKLETPAEQREAWTEAVEQSGGKPAAKDVEAAVEKVQERKTRPLPEYSPTPEAAERIAEAEKDSETLWSLKSYWKKATKKDRAAFMAWSKNN